MKSSGERTRGDLNGFLDSGCHIEGELRFEDTFRIDGELQGKIVSSGELVVGEQGRVDGEIHTRTILVFGRVKGRLEAETRIEIAASGRVEGELVTPALVIEDGATFEGQCSMITEGGRQKGARGPESAAQVSKLPMTGSSKG
ncbi:MAG TPA: polymer-forming cytoskeletal protein [Thermoanaerobaculia bacterium]|nr:polymer-forming cytoskeletal protein [Thermoanaerobaculia bacterium]